LVIQGRRWLRIAELPRSSHSARLCHLRLALLLQMFLMTRYLLEYLLVLRLDPIILLLHLRVLVHQLLVLLVQLTQLALQLHQLLLQDVRVIRVEVVHHLVLLHARHVWVVLSCLVQLLLIDLVALDGILDVLKLLRASVH